MSSKAHRKSTSTALLDSKRCLDYANEVNVRRGCKVETMASSAERAEACCSAVIR